MSTADKLKRLLTCVVTVCSEDYQYKAYAMISLGHAVSRFINKKSDRKQTAIQFDLAQDLAEGLQCKHQLKTFFYDS